MHSCPECGEACYCHGDIDDCEIPGEELYCDHWKRCDREEEEDAGESYADYEIARMVSTRRSTRKEEGR